ncbi:hypothetical protein HYU22_03680, partial [Candidatus Woesearchaeota archaeon]|nr:hypothetical protein [Candidatus Woesearchaeota archaeon]
MADNKPEKKEGPLKKESFRKDSKEAEVRTEGEIRFSPGIPAEVREIVARAGSRGELTQVMAQVL